MNTPKRIEKGITKKFKNWRSSLFMTASKETATDRTQGPSASRAREETKKQKLPECIFSSGTTMKQQTLCPTVMETATNIGTTTCDKNIEKALKDNHSVTTTKDKDATSVIDKAGIELCENINKNLDNIGKPPTKATRQRQAIMAGIVGIRLLASSVAFHVLEMSVIVVVTGIAGLACISFALYNILKPNMQLEKVENTEHPIASFESKSMIKNPYKRSHYLLL